MKAQLDVWWSMKTLKEAEWCNKARPFDIKKDWKLVLKWLSLNGAA